MKVFALAIVLAMTACGSISVEGDDGDNGAGSDGGGAADSGTGGGGGGGTGPFLAKSGGRIKMRVLTTPDGAKSFQGWHDTELDLDCGFGVASDGKTRCLPSSSAGLSVGGLYSNDACTGVPLAYTTSDCISPSTVSYVNHYENVGDQCAPDNRITIYDGVTTYEGPVWVGTSEDCNVFNVAGYRYYTLGPVVPPSTFQSGTVAIE